MLSEADTQKLEFIEALHHAYNEHDFDTLTDMLDADFIASHVGRLEPINKAEFVASFPEVLRLFPDRRLLETTRCAVNGDVVFRETGWEGTPQGDLPDGAKAGRKMKIEVCSIMVVREQKLLEWKDFG